MLSQAHQRTPALLMDLMGKKLPAPVHEQGGRLCPRGREPQAEAGETGREGDLTGRSLAGLHQPCLSHW